jgi:hypothetical protein
MIPVETLRAWVGADASEDALLQDLERAAVARVEQHLGLAAGALGTPAERVDVVPGSGTSFLFLPGGVATNSAPAVTIAERAYPGATPTTLIAGTDYERRGARLVRLGGAHWVAYYEYTITSTVGYAEADAPPLLREAVLQLVSITYGQRGTEDVQSETVGDYSYTRTYSQGGGGQSAIDVVLARLPRRVRV